MMTGTELTDARAANTARRGGQRYHDPDHAGAPLEEAPEESGPIAREQQRRKDSGHEEDKRVQQGEDAEASGRLAEQIERESRRDRSSGRVTRVRVHESDVLVHAEGSVADGFMKISPPSELTYMSSFIGCSSRQECWSKTKARAGATVAFERGNLVEPHHHRSDHWSANPRAPDGDAVLSMGCRHQ